MGTQVDNCIEVDGEIVSMNNAKIGAAFIRSVTPPLSPTERRRKWSAALASADGWLQMARKDCRRRDYAASKEAVLCAASALDRAMLYAEAGE